MNNNNKSKPNLGSRKRHTHNNETSKLQSQKKIKNLDNIISLTIHQKRYKIYSEISSVNTLYLMHTVSPTLSSLLLIINVFLRSLFLFFYFFFFFFHFLWIFEFSEVKDKQASAHNHIYIQTKQ